MVPVLENLARLLVPVDRRSCLLGTAILRYYLLLLSAIKRYCVLLVAMNRDELLIPQPI